MERRILRVRAAAYARKAQGDDKLMLQLEDAILHHVNDEREKMFPKARATPSMDLMELADRLEARKNELMANA